MPDDLPAGTLTCLFTDIEDSTRLVQRLGDRYAEVLDRYRHTLRTAVQAHQGFEVDTQGDGCFFVFTQALAAAAAAVAAQQALAAEGWPNSETVRVRMGLHTGEPTPTATGYIGLDVHHTARLCAAAHGGQVLLSQTTHTILDSHLPGEWSLRDLGLRRLKGLAQAEHIYQLTAPGLPAIFLPVRTLDVRPSNLPIAPTAFVGRAREVAAVSNLLRRPEHRLLTLTGLGGIGKTRLAVQVANALLDEFEDGAYFVRLASLSSPDFVLTAIAQAIQFSFLPEKDSLTQLNNYLRAKEMLLVIDNFEHVLPAAEIVDAILQAAAGVKVLATSRERLNLYGETVFEVQGLSVPQGDSLGEHEPHSAIDLFLQSAHQAAADRSFSPEDQTQLIRICRLVEGLPLAIELAAAWVNTLPCAQIAQAIEHNLDFLAVTYRNLPERQRSLRAVFEYSWSLLTVEEQRGLSQLSVFRGGFDVEAAQPIAGTSNRLLDSLTHKSLLRSEAPTLYEMHRVLQQYAEEKLQSSPAQAIAVQERRGLYHLQFLAERLAWLKDARQVQALPLINSRIGDMRAAWRWALDHRRLAEIENAAEALCRFYELRSWYVEGEEAFRAAAQALALEPPEGERGAVWSEALAYQGWFTCRLGRYEEGQQLLNQCLPILRRFGRPAQVVSGLNTLGMIEWYRGSRLAARQVMAECLALCRQIGDPWSEAFALNLLGNLTETSENEQARQLYEESLTLRRAINDLAGVAISLNNLGHTAFERGDYLTSQQLHQESLAIQREVGNQAGISLTLNNLGYVAYLLGDYAQARRLQQESLAIRRDIGDERGSAYCWYTLGITSYALGDYAAAEEHLQQALAIFQKFGAALEIGHTLSQQGLVAWYQGNRALARERLSAGLAAAELLADWGGLAFARSALGELAIAENDFGPAQQLLAQALQDSLAYQLPFQILSVLFGLAQLWVVAGDKRQAYQLLAYVHGHPATEHQVRLKINPLLDRLANELKPAPINEHALTGEPAAIAAQVLAAIQPSAN